MSACMSSALGTIKKDLHPVKGGKAPDGQRQKAGGLLADPFTDLQTFITVAEINHACASAANMAALMILCPFIVSVITIQV